MVLTFEGLGFEVRGLGFRALALGLKVNLVAG